MKFIGAISSLAAGVCTFVFFCLTCFTSTLGNASTTYTGWSLFSQDWGSVGGYTMFTIFAIVAMVFAALLIVMGFLLLFRDLNAIKLKFKLNLINNVVLAILLVCSILVFVAILILAGKMTEASLLGTKYAAGVGIWLLLIVSALACVFGWIFSRPEKAKKGK